MELLALLKRLAPLLGRLVPMLEMFVATRGTSNTSTEALERLATHVADLKQDSTEAVKRHEALVTTAAQQSSMLEALRKDLRLIREADERGTARLLELEIQVSTLSKTAQSVKQLLIAVLVICLLLLIALYLSLFRHAS